LIAVDFCDGLGDTSLIGVDEPQSGKDGARAEGIETGGRRSVASGQARLVLGESRWVSGLFGVEGAAMLGEHFLNAVSSATGYLR